jgi:hypothetical protein
MKVHRGNSVRALLAAGALALIAFLFLAEYAPDTVALSPNNYGWNGLQGVASTYNVNFTTSLSSLPPKGVLVIIQPSINFTNSESDHIRNFLASGGIVLVADNSGVSNYLLKTLGSSISIQSGLSISDRTYNWKSETVPTALVLPDVQARIAYLAGVEGIALSQPSPLTLSSTKATEVAITSPFSTASPTGEGITSMSGPFVVMADQSIGNGSLVVVGDSQFLINSEWTTASNRVLIGNLFTGTTVLIDASHWGASSTAQLKAELGSAFSFISAFPTRYVAVLLMVGFALGLVPSKEKGPRKQTTPFNGGTHGLSE